MKTIKRICCLISLFIGLTSSGLCQEIIWSVHFGGSEEDFLQDIIPTKDGGIIAVGATSSADHDLTGLNYSLTAKVRPLAIKLDAAGNIDWVNIIGGTSGTYYPRGITSAIELSNGGYLFSGARESSGNSIRSYILKVDSAGVPTFSTSYGGSGQDSEVSTMETADGGFLIGGSTTSSDGNLPGNNGLLDCFLIKTDSSGSVIWGQNYGGSSHDVFRHFIELSNGNYVVVAFSASNDGDVQGNHGAWEMWVFEVDTAGIMQWQRCFGSSANDGARAVSELPNGNLLIFGTAGTENGDVTSTYGGGDTWVIEYDPSGLGTIVSDKVYGGSHQEGITNVTTCTDGGFLMSGWTYSNNGLLSPNGYGGSDAWYCRIDSSTNLVWQKRIGGSNSDHPHVFAFESSPESYIFSSSTSSDDGHMPVNYGKRDIWIYKVSTKFNTFCGKVYFDANNNGVQDTLEPNIPGATIRLENGPSSNSISTNSNGNFSISTDTGAYNISLWDQLPPYFQAAPNPYTQSYNTYENKDTVDFRIYSDTVIQDLAVNLLPIGVARPGFEASYCLLFSNHGTQIESGQLQIIYPSNLLNLSYANDTSYVAAGDTITWSYQNLLPTETRKIQLRFQLAAPPILNNGDTISLLGEIHPINSDGNPTNNISEISQILQGSYDPNDKAILSEENILIDSINENTSLTYLIRFQNTGTDTAFTVTIRDTLDNLLDGRTLEVLAASHPFNIKADENQKFQFIFNNILLPDSNVNESESHGFISYLVKPKPGLKIGDTIQNSASIYFDFNLPILTNTVKTQIIEKLTSTIDQNNIEQWELKVYPNPLSDWLFIDFNEKPRESIIIELNDVQGRLVKSLQLKPHDKKLFKIKMTNLESGIYFLTIKSGEKRAIHKISK